MDWTPPADFITCEINWYLSRGQCAFSTEPGISVSNEQHWHPKTQKKKKKRKSESDQLQSSTADFDLSLSRFSRVRGYLRRLCLISAVMKTTFPLEKIYGESRENGRRSKKKEIKKKHQALKILLPLSAFNHSRSSGVYDRSGISPSSAVKYCDLGKFSPSAVVSPCGCVNVAVGKTPRLAVQQFWNWIFFSPFLRWMTYTACCTPPFWILQSLIRSLLWKYSNLPGAHVSPYPVKDGLRLLWVFKNRILMAIHPKPGCVFLTAMRSHIL